MSNRRRKTVDSYGVPMKINRHVLRALRYFQSLPKPDNFAVRGVRRDILINEVRFTTRNLVPVVDPPATIWRSLENFCLMGVVKHIGKRRYLLIDDNAASALCGIPSMAETNARMQEKAKLKRTDDKDKSNDDNAPPKRPKWRRHKPEALQPKRRQKNKNNCAKNKQRIVHPDAETNATCNEMTESQLVDSVGALNSRPSFETASQHITDTPMRQKIKAKPGRGVCGGSLPSATTDSLLMNDAKMNQQMDEVTHSPNRDKDYRAHPMRLRQRHHIPDSWQAKKEKKNKSRNVDSTVGIIKANQIKAGETQHLRGVNDNNVPTSAEVAERRYDCGPHCDAVNETGQKRPLKRHRIFEQYKRQHKDKPLNIDSELETQSANNTPAIKTPPLGSIAYLCAQAATMRIEKNSVNRFEQAAYPVSNTLTSPKASLINEPMPNVACMNRTETGASMGGLLAESVARRTRAQLIDADQIIAVTENSIIENVCVLDQIQLSNNMNTIADCDINSDEVAQKRNFPASK